MVHAHDEKCVYVKRPVPVPVAWRPPSAVLSNLLFCVYSCEAVIYSGMSSVVFMLSCYLSHFVIFVTFCLLLSYLSHI